MSRKWSELPPSFFIEQYEADAKSTLYKNSGEQVEDIADADYAIQSFDCPVAPAMIDGEYTLLDCTCESDPLGRCVIPSHKVPVICPTCGSFMEPGDIDCKRIRLGPDGYEVLPEASFVQAEEAEEGETD